MRSSSVSGELQRQVLQPRDTRQLFPGPPPPLRESINWHPVLSSAREEDGGGGEGSNPRIMPTPLLPIS